jgi:hypothetical protein
MLRHACGCALADRGTTAGHFSPISAIRNIQNTVRTIRRAGLIPRQAETSTFIPASVVLQQLHDQAPADHFTLGWLMNRLDKQSFGLIMLLLAIVAAAPGISILGGLLLLIPAVQMIAGRSAPIFPRWIADRSLPTKHLGAVVQRAVSVLRYLETVVRPRWPTSSAVTKRVVGIFVVLLSARLLLSPIPLSNILPAVLIALISLGYLEEDGLLLSISLLAAVVVLAIDLGLVWNLLNGAKRIGLSDRAISCTFIELENAQRRFVGLVDG